MSKLQGGFLLILYIGRGRREAQRKKPKPEEKKKKKKIAFKEWDDKKGTWGP